MARRRPGLSVPPRPGDVRSGGAADLSAPPRAARVAVSVVFLLTGATFATWAARVPAVQDRLELSSGGLALALLGLSVGAFVGLPLVGGLVARLGSRLVLAGGAGVYVGGLLLVAAAEDLPVLMAALFVFACGNSGLDVAMNTQGMQVERAYGRAVLGGFHAMFSLGGILGAAVGAAAAAAGTSVGVHLGAAAGLAGLGFAAAVVALLPDPPGAVQREPVLSLPSRGLWIPGAIAFCGLMSEGVVNDWGAVYLEEVTGAGQGTAALGFATFSAGMVACRLTADRIRDRIGAAQFITGCGLTAACGVFVVVVFPAPGAALAGFLLLGLGMAGVIPTVFGHAVAVRPAQPGPAIAAVSTVGYVGFLAGPPTIGAIAAATSLRIAMLVLLVLTAAMALLAPRLVPSAQASEHR